MRAGEGVVFLVRLRNSDNKGGFPSGVVDSKFDRGTDNGAEFVRTNRMGPFQNLIVETGEARGGGIRSAGKSVNDFLFRNRDERTGVWVGETLRDGEITSNDRRGRKPRVSEEFGFLLGGGGPREVGTTKGGGN